MQPPDELMVGVFLPSMRQLVARVLRSQGISQSKISAMLGVTQASVSVYLSTKPERAYAALASLSVQREVSDRYASLLAEDVKRNSVYGVETLSSIWRSMLGNGVVCEAHRRMYPSLSQCDVCIEEYGSKESDRSGAIAQVSEAVRLLESSSAFVAVMPEVSVNIAYAPADSSSPDQVVAVPGRVVKVRGSARALLPPEFGASTHMARILLLVKKRRPGVQASVNLRYDRKMRRVLRRLRLRALEVGEHQPSGLGDPAVSALASKLDATTTSFDVVIDPGGKGVEPNLYLFGRSAVEVAGLAVKIAKLYSAH